MDPETLIVALRKNAVLVVMHVVLGALVGLGFGLLTPAQYTSTTSAKLAVENRPDDPNAPSPISSFDKIIPTLVALGTSESTLSEVSKSTGISQAELGKSISVSAKTGTFIIEIKATSTDPERAHAIAQAEIGTLDSVAREQSYLVPGSGDLTLAVDNPPTTPTSPSSLSAVSTALIGAAIGLAAGAIMAILLYFLSKKNPQDKVEDPLLIIGRRRSRKES